MNVRGDGAGRKRPRAARSTSSFSLRATSAVIAFSRSGLAVSLIVLAGLALAGVVDLPQKQSLF